MGDLERAEDAELEFLMGGRWGVVTGPGRGCRTSHLRSIGVGGRMPRVAAGEDSGTRRVTRV